MISFSSLKIHCSTSSLCCFAALQTVTVPQEDQCFNLHSEDFLFSELYKQMKENGEMVIFQYGSYPILINRVITQEIWVIKLFCVILPVFLHMNCSTVQTDVNSLIFPQSHQISALSSLPSSTVHIQYSLYAQLTEQLIHYLHLFP